MRRLLLIAFLVLLSNFGQGQTTGAGFIIYVGSAPSGTCSAGAYQENVIGLGTVYTCQSGTWTQVGGGGGSTAFSAITGATNSTAAMIIGTGASLTVSGSGTNTATGLTGSPAITVSSCTGCGGGTGTALQTAYFTATNTIGGYLAAGPDVPPISANAMDDEFNGAALNVKWTGANLGSSTFAEASGMGSLTGFQTNNAFSLKNYLQAVPSTPWTMTARMNLQTFVEGCNKFGGLIVSDGTKFELIGPGIPNNSTWSVLYEAYTNSTTSSANTALKAAAIPIGGWVYLQIQDDGTNLNYNISYDGVNFLQAKTELRGAFLTTGPTKVGWGADATQTVCTQAFSIDWFRRTQ